MSEAEVDHAAAAAAQAKEDARMMREAAEDPTAIHVKLDAEFEKKNYLKVHQKLTCVPFAHRIGRHQHHFLVLSIAACFCLVAVCIFSRCPRGLFRTQMVSTLFSPNWLLCCCVLRGLCLYEKISKQVL